MAKMRFWNGNEYEALDARNADTADSAATLAGENKQQLLQPIQQQIDTHKATNPNKAHGGFKGTLLKLLNNLSVANSSSTTLVWEAVEYDNAGCFSPSSPNRLTVPAGVTKVRLLSNVMWTSGGGQGYKLVRIRKNGTGAAGDFIGQGYVLTDTTGSNNVRQNAASTIINVQPGDYFVINVFHVSGAAVDVAADNSTWFALEVVE